MQIQLMLQHNLPCQSHNCLTDILFILSHIQSRTNPFTLDFCGSQLWLKLCGSVVIALSLQTVDPTATSQHAGTFAVAAG